MATIRNLKIKTSTCNRIVKELHSYEKEVEREAAKTADMKDKGADPYDLKQQVAKFRNHHHSYNDVLLPCFDLCVFQKIQNSLLFVR